jgi:hypothetical protein
MIKLTFQLITAIVITIIAIRETIQLVRNWRDLPLRVLVPGLWCLALAASLGIPRFALKPVASLVGKNFNDILNSCNLIMAFCFATFFVLVQHELTARQRRTKIVRDLTLLVVGIGIYFVVRQIGPEGWAQIPRTTTEYRHNVYRLVYMWSLDIGNIGFWSLGVWRGLRFLKSVSGRWPRASLILVIGGAAAFDLGVFGTGLVIDVLHPLVPTAPQRFTVLGHVYITALVAGQSAMTLGLALPALAAFISRIGALTDRMLQARYRRPITSLWRILTSEYPHMMLQARENDGTAAASNRVLEPGFDRAMREVTDGLALLAPYYIAGGLDPVAASKSDGVREPQAAARIVHGTLRVRKAERDQRGAGAELRSPPPYPRLVPEFDGWRDMARWLAQLSGELDRITSIARPDHRRGLTPS